MTHKNQTHVLFLLSDEMQKHLAITIIVSLFFTPLPAHCRNVAVALDLNHPNRAFDSVLRPYMIIMRSSIQQNWLPTTVKQALKTRLRFVVKRDGSVEELVIEKSSGQSSFDESTLVAVKLSTPFRPNPTPDQLEVTAIFDNRYVNALEVANLLDRKHTDGKALQTNQLRIPAEGYQGNSSATQVPIEAQQNRFHPPEDLPTPQSQPISPAISTGPSRDPIRPLKPPVPTPTDQTSGYTGLPLAGNLTPNIGNSSNRNPFSPKTVPAPPVNPLPIKPQRRPNPVTSPPPGRSVVPPTNRQGRLPGRLPFPPEWLHSGRDGKHYIKKVSDDGEFLLLDDGSVWESEDESESSSWSDGDEVYVRNGVIINLDQSGEKIDAHCEERACVLLADTYVSGDFEGSDKPAILDNGMIFELTTYHYHYAYHPEALVLISKFNGFIFYKVIIGDEIYDATRIR